MLRATASRNVVTNRLALTANFTNSRHFNSCLISSGDRAQPRGDPTRVLRVVEDNAQTDFQTRARTSVSRGPNATRHELGCARRISVASDVTRPSKGNCAPRSSFAPRFQPRARLRLPFEPGVERRSQTIKTSIRNYNADDKFDKRRLRFFLVPRIRFLADTIWAIEPNCGIWRRIL